MNRYGNKVGFHNPEKTEQILNKINSLSDVTWMDNSWHNDTVDSLHYEITDTPHKFVEIYLPNSDVTNIDEELYNDYSVTNELREELLITEDINELIEFTNRLLKTI
tara:strand:+ start:473 stop:793 length:321 start_codon:yes stop_codon:yes gene_type:complete